MTDKEIRELLNGEHSPSCDSEDVCAWCQDTTNAFREIAEELLTLRKKHMKSLFSFSGTIAELRELLVPAFMRR